MMGTTSMAWGDGGRTTVSRVTINGLERACGPTNDPLFNPPAQLAVCAAGGHHIGGELVHYLDGQIIGRCRDCDVRVVIDWFPGGTAVARVKGLVALLMGADELTEQMVENFHRAAELLEEDAEAIDDARDLVKITKQVIARRLREE